MCAKTLFLLFVMCLPLAGTPWLYGQNPPVSANERAEANAHARTDSFGDALPFGVIQRFGAARFQHAHTLLALAYSHDGQVLASGGRDNVVRIWEPSTGKELRCFRRDARLTAFALTRDGNSVALGGGDGLVLVWDQRNEKQTASLAGHRGPIRSVAFSHDGGVLATAGQDMTVRLWDLKQGKEIVRLESDDPIVSVSLSPDAKLVATGNEDGSPRLWHTNGAKRAIHLGGHSKAIIAVAFSPDGKVLASCSPEAGCFWDPESGRQLVRFAGHYAGRFPLAFSPDGKTLAVCCDPGGVELRAVPSGNALRWRRIQSGASLDCIVFAPDGKTLATGTSDDHVIRHIDIARDEIISVRASPFHNLRCLTLSPDGATLATGDGMQSLRLWDTATGKETRRLGGAHGFKTIAFSPVGSALYFPEPEGDGCCLRLYDSARDKLLHRFSLPPSIEPVCLTVSPDGKVLAVKEWSGITVFLWETATGAFLRQIRTNGGGCRGLAFSPDSKVLACDKDERTVSFWEIATGKECGPELRHDKSVKAFALSSDGRTAATWSEDGYIHLWIWPAAQLRTRFLSLQRQVYDLTFSPDGRTLAAIDGRIRLTRSDEDNSGEPAHQAVCLWEAATGQPRRLLAGGHRNRVIAVAFAQDGKRLASGSADDTILIWEVYPVPAGGEPTPERLKGLWQDLADRDASKAFAAIAGLVAAPERTVPFLGERLRSAGAADRRVGSLIADLDDETFAVREAAEAGLKRLGPAAAPALRRALAAKPSADVRRRAERLLQQWEEAEVLTPDLLRVIRAVEALERIGSREARLILRELADGAREARVIREAEASLKRLNSTSPPTP